MSRRYSRRTFLKQSAGAGVAFWVSGSALSASKSPNDKLNVGFIATGGRAQGNLEGISNTENVVALCDVDELRLGKAAEMFPGAKKYRDFRKMLEQKDIDAVAVSTPDHTHAVAAIHAMNSGRHVYCEKPLAHSIFETRAMTKAAAKNGIVSQMGNQLHATDRLRRTVELVKGGVIGPVNTVYVWSDKKAVGGNRPKETPPVPANLDWDLWLGPTPYRPYHPDYLPFTWRGWWSFGSGILGDMACHIVDTAFWALDLDYPTHITAEGSTAPHPESAPDGLKVTYEYPARGNRGPVTMVWYDGTYAPPKEVSQQHAEGAKLPGQGILFVGEQGTLLLPHAGGPMDLFPKERFVDFKQPPETLPRVPGQDHHFEWIEACKGRGKALSNFDYGGPMTETVLAGIVAYRAGKPLEWDGPNMKATNCPEAEAFIHPEFRDGWF